MIGFRISSTSTRVLRTLNLRRMYYRQIYLMRSTKEDLGSTNELIWFNLRCVTPFWLHFKVRLTCLRMFLAPPLLSELKQHTHRHKHILRIMSTEPPPLSTKPTIQNGPDPSSFSLSGLQNNRCEDSRQLLSYGVVIAIRKGVITNTQSQLLGQ